MKNCNINYITNTIELTKKFAKAAGVLNSPEYNELLAIRRDYPTLPIVIREIKRKAGKKTYPNIKQHLLKYWPILLRRREAQSGAIKPFQLQWARTQSIFEGEKIVVPYRTKENAFAYNDVEWFCRSDAYVITPKRAKVNLFFLLGVLNSKLNYVWLYNRGKRKGEVLELFQVPLSEIPIIELNDDKMNEIADLAKRITEKKRYKPNEDTSEEEMQIDYILYEAYNLSDTEIEIVEKAVPKVKV